MDYGSVDINGYRTALGGRYYIVGILLYGEYQRKERDICKRSACIHSGGADTVGSRNTVCGVDGGEDAVSVPPVG